MAGTSSPDEGNRKSCSLTVSTKLLRIATLAREDSTRVLTALSHHIDADWLEEAYRLTRKDGATGVDGQTAAKYEQDLGKNLESLLGRFKSEADLKHRRGRELD